jgi:two-component system cell cycle sensor histidine kinase/response regulator CckA
MDESLIKNMQDKIDRLENEVKVLRSQERENRKIEAQLRQIQKMEAFAALAGGVAHDFNNILQAILGATQILLLNKNEGSPDYEKLIQIEKASNKGCQLIRQYLSLGRKVEKKQLYVNLNDRIKEVQNLLRRTIPRMISIELDLTDDLKGIKFDDGQIDQIIMNLGINARDAMLDGGALTLKTENIRLSDAPFFSSPHQPNREYVLLTVSDTGVGMSQETVEHIFEPFYTTKEPGKGTGLGLSTVKTLINENGGFIECFSRFREGTTFKLYFPVGNTDKEDQEAENESEKAGVINGTETILLVEDEKSVLEAVKEMLENHGYHVITAENGEDAIAQFLGGSIDMVVLDIGMPGIGGIKCLKKILAIENRAKIIISSGYSRDTGVNEALRLGARAFVAKPYLSDEILRTIRKTLDS